jgi:uncharacterized protein YciI
MLESVYHTAMAWFVKIEKGRLPKAEFDRYVPAHKDYVQSLIDRGHQAQTGYWREFGGGMMLFQADSLEEAQQIVAADPLVQNQCVEYDLHEWCVVVPKTVL